MEYDKCSAAKDALRAEGERAGLEHRRRLAQVEEAEVKLDGDIRAFEAARGAQQTQLDEDKKKVREHAEVRKGLRLHWFFSFFLSVCCLFSFLFNPKKSPPFSSPRDYGATKPI